MVVSNFERVREDLTPKQRQTLVERLQDAGFKVNNIGHVEPIDVKEGHPKSTAMFINCQVKPPLPVGFIGSNYAMLVNLDDKFPEDYHSRLREIYNLVLKS